MRRHYLFYILAAVLLSACTDNLTEEPNHVSDEAIIQIGGVETDEISVSYELTRAGDATPQDAETVPWLRTPFLTTGLDITYGRVNGGDDEKAVAKLKLVKDDSNSDGGYKVENGLAVYTFNTLNQSGDETTPAIWFGNGAHYFQGVYVPDNIRYGATGQPENAEGIDKAGGTAPNLTTDLSSTADGCNFNLLARYLSMPANTRLSATVERVKLPFRHRLAHVIVYVLIDPSIAGATIKGYKGGKKEDGTFNNSTENPSTSSILFRNVMMLKGVEDIYNETTKLHTLTPQWENFVPRVIPHFYGEHGSVYSNGTPVTGAENNFILFVNNKSKAVIYPTDNGKWDDIKSKWDARYNKYIADHSTEANKETKAIEDANTGTGYTRTDYGLVPCYDIILRPTYTTDANVMYDEAGYNTEQGRKDIAALKNNIDFDIILSNDLQYEKSVAIDLNANEETVVYLRISRESIDYNTSGAEKWIRDTANDGWYGLNNKNGNTLSKAGSSWQRAYIYGAEVAEVAGTASGVTDGQFYNASSTHEENEKAQYFTSNYQAQWVEKFLQAYQGGEHHGDYFALKSNISIDARLIPQDFVFTGHLDAQDHTITLTNTGGQVYKAAESLEGLFTKSSTGYVEYTVPEHLYRKNDTREYYSSDEIIEIENVSYDKSTVNITDATYYTQEEIDAAIAKTTASDYTAGDDPDAEITAQKNVGDEKTPIIYDTSNATQASVGDVKSGDISYDEVTISLDILLGTEVLYLDNFGNETFSHPTALYQFSHNSSAYLFAGINGTYTTAQENDVNATWEANVHKETNKKTIWVPVAGYRAEILNLKVSGGTLFPTTTDSETGVTTMTPTPYTGNVQNCFNGTVAIENNTPALPQYKNE